MRVFIIAAALVALALAADDPSTKSTFDLRASFDLADADKDGDITKAEFDGLYATFDDDKDGKITASEFAVHYTKTGMSAKGSVYIFYKLDTNDDDSVIQSEVDNIFNKFDATGDRKVNFQEYSAVMNVILSELAAAGTIGLRLDVLFANADGVDDTDGSLSRDELWGTLSPADTNGNKLVSADEFKTYWMAQTGETEQRTTIFFDILDGDKSGSLGEVAEKQALFLAMDYDKDMLVSKDEFDYLMLYFYAHILRKVKAEMMTFNSDRAFKMVDTNGDGFLSKMEYAPVDEVNITSFVTYYASTGMSVSGSLYIFFRLDENEDSKLTRAEIEDAFDLDDKNDDGKLSFDEYAARMTKIFQELEMAKATGAKLDVLFAGADNDADNSLTRVEMASIFIEADTDKNGEVSEAEFKTFWTDKTMEPVERTDLLFSYLDEDDDGSFGNDMESKDLFNGFDHNNDDMVSKEEFDNSMLFLFAKAMGDLETAKAAKEVLGFFF